MCSSDIGVGMCTVLMFWWGCVQKSELAVEELDWWSKYYASLGETNKCRKYMESGYYKIKVITGQTAMFSGLSCLV